MRRLLLASTAIACLVLASQATNAQSSDQKKDEVHQQNVDQSEHGPAEGRHERARSEKPDHAKSVREGASERRSEGSTAHENSRERAGSKNAAAPATHEPKSAQQHSGAERRGAEAQSQSEPKSATAEHKDARRKADDQEEKAGRNGSTPLKAENKAGAKQESSQADSKAKPGNENAATGSTERHATGLNDQQKKTTAGARTHAQSSKSAQAAANVSPEKKTRISETFAKTRDVAPPVRDLHVSISVGTEVPDRVRLHRVPEEIVSIEPAYRDYDYFTTESEIVIVEPGTRRIVTEIPRNASTTTEVQSETDIASSGGAAPCSVLRREPSGRLTRLRDFGRSTTGSESGDHELGVRVQAPDGRMTPSLHLQSDAGRIIAETDGHGDCRIILEPGRH